MILRNTRNPYRPSLGVRSCGSGQMAAAVESEAVRCFPLSQEALVKKIINQPERVVQEMIEGLVGMHAGWTRLQGQNAILRADFIAAREQQVALISGGG